MSENMPPSSATAPNGDVPGQPYYEKARLHLKQLLQRKQELDMRLQRAEDVIYKKETEYLEETPAGNIITGFEAYTKGVSTAGGQRRRAQVVESNRVFSRSSVSWNVNAVSFSFPILSSRLVEWAQLG
jgi:chromatin modification-related protein EAF6